MMVSRKVYGFIIVIFSLILTTNAIAQNVSIRTDRNQILIGEKIVYDLEVSVPSPSYTLRFNLPDTIAHFDIIDKGSFDTVNENGGLLLKRKMIFTSFDSGSWYIPSFSLDLLRNNSNDKIFTDSALINVGYSPADSTNTLRDIKPIIEVDAPDYFWWYVTGAVLAALIVMLLLYFYFKRKKPATLPVLHSPFTAYDEAMKALKELATLNTNDTVQVKQYHSELSFILKRYYSRITDNNLLNKTTGGFLLKLKEQDPRLITLVAETLRIGDAVKFARYLPSMADSENCLRQIKETIETLEKNKPVKKSS